MKFLKSAIRWLTRLYPFGTDKPLANRKNAQYSRRPFDDVSLDKVWNVLNRSTDVESLRELHRGLSERERPHLGINQTIAFGFDANAIFRLGLGAQGANSLDYLTNQHYGPVIIPGQAVQEVWNNFLAGVEPNAKAVSRKLGELENELATIGQELGVLGDGAKAAVQALIKSHGDWTDSQALVEFEGAVRALLSVGEVTYVPRDEFYRLAQVRKETKTPPGFRDESTNFGDFFIWADFLYGLAKADLDGVDAVVMVTNDQKSDWSRNSVPHPILVSEARSISGKEFRLWTLKMFQDHVKVLAS